MPSLSHARDSLEGLSVGDAIGEALSYRCTEARERSDVSFLADGNVFYTDDTAMALSVFAGLQRSGGISEAALAFDFARAFRRDPDRGYGRMARHILGRIAGGEDWETVSREVFGGSGSFGNGAAMRVAPLGAYFAGDPEEAIDQARSSAIVTHSHPEGIAGAIAVALAACHASDSRELSGAEAAQQIWEGVLSGTPESEVLARLRKARTMTGLEPAQVVLALGNGAEISAQDTVPFCIWNACKHLDDYREAVVSAIEVDGDCDTNAAIVGGIVAARLGRGGIPDDWLRVRERLPL